MCAPFAGAERKAAPDRSAHLLLVPGEGHAAAALAGSDARVIARYGAFSLVEAAGADERALREAGADRRDDMRDVALPGGSVDPLRERESLAARGAREPAEAQLVVQFVGPVKDDWLARVRATGARIVQYVAQNGYVVHARGREIDRLAALVGTDRAVRAVTRVRAADKLVGVAGRGTSSRAVAVQTLAGRDGIRARREGLDGGRALRDASTVGRLRTQYLSLSGREIGGLVADPAVVNVTPYTRPELLDERAAQIVAGNLNPAATAPSGPGYLAWHDARFQASAFAGFSIDFTDEGLDNGSESAPAHPDFRVDGNPAQPGRVDYVENYTVDPDARDCNGHGTNVASIATGLGTQLEGGGYRPGLGVAPRARLGVSKLFECSERIATNPDYEEMARRAYANGARITNNSWGQTTVGGEYDSLAQQYDSLVRDAQPGTGGNEEMVEVVAAGNEGDNEEGAGNEGYGSIRSPAVAKNVITVGASEGVRAIDGAPDCGVPNSAADRANDLLYYSSRGPTGDSRQKPDLVAPGSHVVGASPQIGADYTGARTCRPSYPAGNAFYNLISGTSQAAPALSGAAALVRAWYQGMSGVPPSPAMTKAVLVNSATDLAGGGNGLGEMTGPAPNADQGWGRVNVKSLVDAPARQYLDQSVRLQTGQSLTRAYAIRDTSRPANVTLAYTDAPGAIGPVNLVNDLDLVVRQGGRTYRGNSLVGGRSVTGGEGDPDNNVESVMLPGGSAGRISVQVVGTAVGGDGVPGVGSAMDQDFALVVSNADRQQAAVLGAERITLTDRDGDGAVEPGEPFGLGVELLNSGEAGAAGVRGTVSAGGRALFSAAAGNWGTIGPGAAATNAPPFSGTVSPAVRCGTDFDGSVALSTGGSAAFTVPTGSIGPPVTRSRSQPSAIPDDSLTGLSSTIAVPGAGIVKDLDVRVTIDHPWVGDLRVELVAPDGTTVRLVDQPGGPDNGGADLDGTRFDDAASARVLDDGAPYAGTFRPQRDQLARFNGKEQRGTWRLRVRDLYEGITGALVGWDMITRTASCDYLPVVPPVIDPPVPVPPPDRSAPSVTLSSPARGAVLDNRRPTLSGRAGTAAGDSGSVTVRLWEGGSASGGADRTLSARRSAGGGWSAGPGSDLADGLWTARAQQSDASGNTGVSAGVTFRVDTTRPEFALLPVEADRALARSGKVALLAGCGSACRVTAELKGGRGRKRDPVLAGLDRSLAAPGTRWFALKPTRSGRSRLRRAGKATLRVRISAGSRTLNVARRVVLTRVNLAREARRGLRFATACGEPCTVSSRLTMASREARRLEIRARGRARVTVASGRAGASTKPAALTLKLGSGARRKLLRARRAKVTLDTTVRAEHGPEQSSSRRMTLRR